MAVNLSASTTTNFFAMPGNIIKVKRPLGFPPGTGGGFSLVEPINGVILENSVDYIKYKHEKFGRQVIKYISNGGLYHLTFYLAVDSISLHDHSTISTGGPAFATYYTDISQEEGS
jgi:hypothetical protein